jgi:hypothetical protein
MDGENKYVKTYFRRANSASVKHVFNRGHVIEANNLGFKVEFHEEIGMPIDAALALVNRWNSIVDGPVNYHI